jgi:sugar O-acyltransferase (sialic acid O-acetyltransferase NeuD family)
MRVLILGAGGHGQVVADILLRMQDAGPGVVPVGYLDDNPALAGEQLLGLPVLGTVADLGDIPHDALVVAIGDNRIRQRLFESLRAQGERFVIARHPSAVIAPDVPVGPGSMICAGVVVCPGSKVGADVLLNTSCTVDHHNQVGDHVHITPGVHLGGEVTVGEGAFLGIGTSVIPRRTIGPWASVGAGSVVTRDVPAGATAVGMPARVVRRADDELSPRGE